ncbi:YjcZ family sporulation protein [Lysinibacillus telephonicus]|uniref:YjcZ family sporulation protein n=1 Tax=Lysinibacillus telephonicus TaxID=1714840 RepID=A0A431USU3_9BACI|nr:YjcZ family sporulation protein [Lysinibacillus telephonicus]RTQ92521.1 YjcZ family sporulation protein [Lysinibacillus telephonicus]
MGGYDNNYVGGAYDRKDNNFALIVVLFILLIIVGTAFMKDSY